MQASRVATRILSTLLVTTGLAVGQTAPRQPDGLELLGNVEQTYRAMTTYSAKSTAAVEMNGPNMQTKIEIPATFSADSSGRFRTETKGMFGTVMVFDGDTMWFYMPAQNKYSKSSVGKQTASAGATAAALGGTAFGGGSIESYKNLTTNVKEAKVLRSEALNIGGSEVQCWVISVDYEVPDVSDVGPNSDAQSKSEQSHDTVAFDLTALSLLRTLWVDKDHYLVYREDSTNKMTMPGQSGPTKISQSTKYENIVVDQPLPEDTFNFVPPPGATEMNSPLSTAKRPPKQ